MVEEQTLPRKLGEWNKTENKPGMYVPVERLRQPLERWLELEWNSRELLAARSGVSTRIIWQILNNTGQRTVTVRNADRLLVGLDQTELWYLPPEEGGLSDIYFHPDVIEPIEPRRCALDECGGTFVPERRKTIYCCPAHYQRARYLRLKAAA